MYKLKEFTSTEYLYAMWHDRITIKEGHVDLRNFHGRREAVFYYGDKIFERNRCHPESGKVLNGRLWLPERNDELARKLLIEYNEQCIEELRVKISKHEEKIRILQNA